MKKIVRLILSIVFLFAFFAFNFCLDQQPSNNESSNAIDEDIVEDVALDEDGWYSSKEDVALYLQLYEELPDNYLTKQEARDLGWDSDKGNLWDIAEGMSIGGDKFGNREGILPKEKGRQYYECDIDYEGGYRNSKRIVFSNDGLIFYTDDHYESFEEIVGEPE